MEEGGNNGTNNKSNGSYGTLNGALSERTTKWVSSVSGGVAGALLTALFIIIPVINTWLENSKEISMAQIKNSAEQLDYITRRMSDSDKERDLYKKEMLETQAQLRELQKKCK